MNIQITNMENNKPGEILTIITPEKETDVGDVLWDEWKKGKEVK